ncbi:MAG: NlpC/P60 family protein [Henriciella sp.]|nr:NlpC/P60 family protein [Henriciella sp.]
MPEFDDPRLTLPDGGERTLMQVTAGIVALRKDPEPDAEMASQALHGQHVVLHHEEGEFGLVQSVQDRYVGWALMEALSAPALAPTHRVRALRLYVYPRPSIKSAPRYLISLGGLMVSEEEREGRFLKCARAGWVYEDQLSPVDIYESDPAAVAERYLHTPYLWGGRESLGIDCSGLIQQAFAACNITLPRDSDMQGAWAGDPIEDWQRPGALQRNDLVFWKGHVGIMLDDKTLLHGNGFHMAVAAEPLAGSIERIASQYGEPVGARRVKLSASIGLVPDWLKT